MKARGRSATLFDVRKPCRFLVLTVAVAGAGGCGFLAGLAPPLDGGGDVSPRDGGAAVVDDGGDEPRSDSGGPEPGVDAGPMPGDGGAPADGGNLPPADGGVAALPDAGVTCGSPAVFNDGFEDNSFGIPSEWGWGWLNGNAQADEGNGRLRFTLSSVDDEAGYMSPYSISFREAEVNIQLAAQLPGDYPSLYAQLVVGVDGEDYLSIGYEGGEMRANKRVSGSTQGLTFGDYDNLSHRYWRIRETGGSIYFQTSSNGIDYVQQWSTTTPDFVDFAHVTLIGGTYEGYDLAGTDVLFEGVWGQPAVAGYCPLDDSMLAVPGNDGEPLPLAWTSLTTCSGTRTQAGDGGIRFRQPALDVVSCDSGTDRGFSFVDRELVVRLRSHTPGGATIAGVEVRSEDGAGYIGAWLTPGGSVQSEIDVISGTTSGDVFASGHDWIRLRLSGAYASIATGPDGTAWTTRANAVPVGDFSTARAYLFLDSEGASTSGLSEVVFDNITASPAP
jgi:hypothetical protein